jgi:broad-specificity NMP kinase
MELAADQNLRPRKYLITGCAGSGKTTAIRLLQKLGYTAYNTDDLPNSTKLQHRKTGQTIDWPEGKVDWTEYAWNWQKSEIERLLASDQTVFIGAVVSNGVDFYHLFDKVFVITVGADTLKSRLETHEHPTHHLPGEVERILLKRQEKQDLFINRGGIPIDGEQPPEQIIYDILKTL